MARPSGPGLRGRGAEVALPPQPGRRAMSLAVLGTVYPVIFISELPDKTMFASLVLATRWRALAVWAGAATAFAVHVCIAVTVGAALIAWLPERSVQAVAAALFLVGAALAVRGPTARSAPAGPTPGPTPGSGAAGSGAAGSGAAEGLALAESVAPGPTVAEPATGTERVGLTAEATNGTGANSAPSPAAAIASLVAPRRAFLTTFVVIFVAEWGDLTQILTAGLAARFHAPVAVGVGAGLALWTVAALAVLASRPLRRLPADLVRRLTGIVFLALAAFAAVAAATGR
jgi:Ca2+/H+ antiporter, TMEM165/GDT1 family